MNEHYNVYKARCSELKKIGLALEELNSFDNFKDILNQEEFKNVMRLKHNRANKRYRTKDKFLELYRIAMCMKTDKKIVFGTITLNDHFLSLKENTYIRLIHSWLKEHFIYSILNKDFGTKTEREHYHFIGLTDEPIESKGVKSKTGYDIYELKNKNYKLGFEPTLCLIDLDINDIEKTIAYLLKLNNHSNKITTSNRLRIIKNSKADLIIICNNIEPKKELKKAKKSFYEKLKFTSYDELNKRSSSNDESVKELSEDEFVYFLSGKIDLKDL